MAGKPDCPDGGGDYQYCRKCGNRLITEAVFCGNCGERVRPEAPQSAPAKSPRKWKPWAVVTVSAVCTFAVLGGLALLIVQLAADWPF